MSMTDQQRTFFSLLNAPFEPDQLSHTSRGGQTFTYVKAKALMNRLDDVAGVTGWHPEYRATERGYTCKLNILVPDADGERIWLAKEDGGGFEGMSTKGNEQNVDNDEKSAYTNSFRRAAAVWGISRYLWRDGVPDYLGQAPDVPQPPPGAPRPPATRTAAPNRPGPAPAQQNPPKQGNGQYDDYKPARNNRGMYAWCKKQEGFFGAGIVKLADGIAEDRGYPRSMKEWDDHMVEDVSWAIIDEVKTWEDYKGEYDHLQDPRQGE